MNVHELAGDRVHSERHADASPPHTLSLLVSTIEILDVIYENTKTTNQLFEIHLKTHGQH
jgi:hypothetical protein